MNPNRHGLVGLGLFVAVAALVAAAGSGFAYEPEQQVSDRVVTADPDRALTEDDGLQDPPRPRRRPEGGRPGGPPAPAAAPAPPPQPEPKKETAVDEEPKWMAIVGATVHTVVGPELHDAIVLIKDGKIHGVGHRISIPDTAKVIDATGHHVYPGLIGMDSSGITGRGNPSDTTNVFDLTATLGRAAGLTTVVSGTYVAKLKNGSLDGLVVASNMFEDLRYATNQPRRRAEVRKGFEDARSFLRDVEAFQNRTNRAEGDRAPQERDLSRDARSALRLLRGQAKAQVSANDAATLIAVAELAEQYGFEIVIRGVTEGWTVPERLARAKMYAVVVPRDRTQADDRRNRPTGASIENAAILTRHGIPVAVLPPGPYFGPGTGIGLSGLGGRDMLNINMSAAYAARGGLSERDAVRTLTINPARMLGVDHRIGSIEVGKDADLIVTDRPLLDYMMLVRYTIIDGEIAYDKYEEGIFSHIRPEGDMDAPAPVDAWPRRLGAPW